GFQPAGGLPPRLPGLRHGLPQFGMVAVGILQIALGIGAQQALVRVLSVDVDQLVAQFVAGVDVAFGEPGLLRVAGIEHRADVRPSGAFAQHAGVGPPGTRSRASISMGLPASVLPENTVKPGLKAISASSTMTMSRMCRARSMGSLGSVA